MHINGGATGEPQQIKTILVGFEVVTAVRTKMAVFRVVAPCSVVEVYQRFRGRCCLHHQGDESSAIFMQITVYRDTSVGRDSKKGRENGRFRAISDEFQ
jgi:hypothetical protein